MIRYANMNDFAVLRKYEHGIVDCQLKESIAAGRIVIMLSPRSSLIGWLRFNLFWDSIPFINLLYLLDEYRGQGYGKQLLRYWENEMAARNYEKALTSTLSNERRQFFYRKNGYVDCGSILLPNEPLEIFFLKRLTLSAAV